MKGRISRYALPALLAAAIPATVVLAQQTQSGAPPEPKQKRERFERPRLSPETLNRLQDGRLAMIKESLKLDDSQLKLWAPVEQQLRARYTARQQARQEFQQRMEQMRQQGASARPSIADRLDRAAKRMTERAQRMQAFIDAFKPFYASLNDEQKAVAGIVLRERGEMGGHGRRWAMGRGPGDGMQPGPGGPEGRSQSR